MRAVEHHYPLARTRRRTRRSPVQSRKEPPAGHPEGRLLYRHARRLLALADETAALFAGDQAQGALRVGALDVALANHLPRRLARYRRESPGVELHIRPEHSLLLERLLMEESWT